MQIQFEVYGKEGCGLCQNRYDFFAALSKRVIEGSFKNSAPHLKDIEFSVQYWSVDDPLGRAEMIMHDLSEVPAALMRDVETDEILASWDGPKSTPSTRKILEMIIGLGKEP